MRKKLTSALALLLCVAMILSIAPIAVFADDTADEGTTEEEVVERTPIATIKTTSPDNWGSWNGTTAKKVEGAAEDGASTAWVLTGGSGGGGASFSLNVGNFVASSITHKDADGNTIVKTKGFIDATEFGIRYKSVSKFQIKFCLEYRASKKPTLWSKGVTVPSSNGEWATYTIPFSDFAPGDEIKDQWVHNIYGAYTSNFEPVVMMRIEQLNQGASNSMTIDNLFVNWYKEDMVSKVEFGEMPKKSYFQYYDDFDYSQGTIKVYRGGSTTEYEELSLTDPRVSVSGYKNTAIKDNEKDSKNLKITVTVLNNTLPYYVRVVPFAPETLESIEVTEPKTEYFVGDPYDYSTGLIKATYSDKDPEFAALDDLNAKVEGFDTSSAGEKNVTVSYGAKTYEYTINVKDFVDTNVTSIAVKDVRKVYKVGESFNYHDGSIVPYNGTAAQSPLKLYNRYATVTGFDSSAAAEDQEITVTYSGVSTTYKIDIVEDDIPVLCYTTLDMQSGNRPDLWYNDKCKSSYVKGAAEDGVSDAWYFTGSGTAQSALGTGGWGSGTVKASNGSYVTGLIGADAIEIRYRSYNEVSLKFVMEYRASKSPTKSTLAPKVPSTNGEWATAIVPISAFEPAQTGEAFDEKIGSVDWVYNGIKGGYTTNFEPVVKFYVGVKNGTDQSTTIGYVKSLWYDNFSSVESVSVTPKVTKYFDGAELDLTGDVIITYKDGTQRTGTMADFDITYTGFDTSVEEDAVQTVTATYGGKSTTFDVQIVTGGDEIASSVLSDDVRTVYLVGEEFDTSVGNITVKRVNGQETVIPISDESVTITGFDSSAQNSNVPVVISYEDLKFELRIRVFRPNMTYSAPSFTNGSDVQISSFGGVDTVKANIKVRNRVACPSPQSACILAVVYGDNNTLKTIKQFDTSAVPASSEVTVSAVFTADELEGAQSVKIIALDDSFSINNLINGAAVSINR